MHNFAIILIDFKVNLDLPPKFMCSGFFLLLPIVLFHSNRSPTFSNLFSECNPLMSLGTVNFLNPNRPKVPLFYFHSSIIFLSK
jgi:hypothetical protein